MSISMFIESTQQGFGKTKGREGHSKVEYKGLRISRTEHGVAYRDEGILSPHKGV
jgi:hypothetical protein